MNTFNKKAIRQILHFHNFLQNTIVANAAKNILQVLNKSFCQHKNERYQYQHCGPQQG